MSIQSTYKILDQSPKSVFFEIPATIQIDEHGVTPYATSHKIELLIKELTERGPFIALGVIGPKCYQVDPFPLKGRYCGKEIYGWKPGTTRIAARIESCLLILGAKKTALGDEYVFFTLSQDETMDSTSSIRVHKPSPVDQKIYVVSHKTFSENLFDIYPCTAALQEYVKRICELPFNSIQFREECKAIGKVAFDDFMRQAGGNRFAAKDALQKICYLIEFGAQDGFVRKQYVEQAWSGIKE